MISQEFIVRKLQLLEKVKAQLILAVGQVFNAMALKSEIGVKEALAAVIINCYILARRLGIDFSQLDETVITITGNNIKNKSEIEKAFGDYSEYLRYLRQKR